MPRMRLGERCAIGCTCGRHRAHDSGATRKAVQVWMGRGLHVQVGAQSEMARILGVSRARVNQLIMEIREVRQEALKEG